MPESSLEGYGGIGGRELSKYAHQGGLEADPVRLGLCLISFPCFTFFSRFSLCFPLLSVIRNNDTNPLSTSCSSLRTGERLKVAKEGETNFKQAAAKRKRVCYKRRGGDMLRVDWISIYAGLKGMSICREEA